MLALHEWNRVIKQNGHLVMIVPDKSKTFDHRRPVASLQHIIDDYIQEVGEDDVTHLKEILELHDYNQDPGTNSVNEFEERSRQNIKYRCMHHHVFDMPLAVSLVEQCGFKVVIAERMPSCHIVIIATKNN